MKKVAIITIFDNNNFGNRLQNYAVQHLLNNKGFLVETLPNYVEYNSTNNKVNPLLIPFFVSIKHCIKMILMKKYRKLYCFTKRYIISGKMITAYNCSKFDQHYDYFVTGSDQVWNPNIRYLTDIHLLQFASSEKRIALSASFGVSSIEWSNREHYRKVFLSFKDISVREEAGAAIIKDLTGQESSVLIDPTLMLGKEEWEILEKHKEVKGKYLFAYFLSELTDEQKKAIDGISRENHLMVVNVTDRMNKRYFNIDPGEFLYLIHHAELVLTDSFHACIFSIIYEKSFYVYGRGKEVQNMNARIETLLKKFQLEDRYVTQLNSYKFSLECDIIKNIINSEKEKYNKFLDKAFR